MRTIKERIRRVREIFINWEEYKLNLKNQYPKDFSKLERFLRTL